MPRGAKPGERRGGRGKGARNKKTLEREAKIRLAAERLATVEKLESEGIPAVAAAARTSGLKLMKDIAFDFAKVFAGIAAFHQPWPTWHAGPNGKPVNDNPNYDEAKFKEYAVLAKDTAIAAAPFESPRFSAVMIGATTVNKIEVVGGLPDDEDGSLNPGGPIIEGHAEPDPEPIPLPKVVNE